MAALVVRRQAPTPRQCAYISGGYRIRPYGPHANWRLLSAGRCKHRPLQNGSRGHSAPEGSIGRGRKGVKKNAALLHFLAFAFSDHIFGVPRGEQPLSRASRAIGSSGHFFRFLFGCPKRKDWRGNDAIKGDTAGWCPRQAQAAKISSLLFPLHPL